MTLLTKELPLDDDYRVDDDIKTYLEARFAKIKETHLVGGKQITMGLKFRSVRSCPAHHNHQDHR